MMFRNPLAGPDDQSGRVRTSLSVRVQKFIFGLFQFQEGRQEKLALDADGC